MGYVKTTQNYKNYWESLKGTKQSQETIQKRIPKISGKNSSQYKHGLYCKTRNNVCVDCGINISPKAKRCHKCNYKVVGEKISFKVMRENNANWKGGISFTPYPLGWNRTFKEQIRYRDDYKCKICGKPEVEDNKKLSVHHIDYDKNNLRIDNLITLCGKCHTKTNNKERIQWTNYFQKLLKEQYNYGY